MNIQEQKKAVGDSYSVVSAALRGFQASQGLPIDSVDEISLMRSGADDCQLEVLNAFATLFDTLQRFQDELGEEKNESEDADEAALKELNEELRDLMELQGFTHWQTGGGCTAWGKYLLGGNNDKSPYMMIALDDCSEFTTLADAHRKDALMVCFYNSDGDWLGSSDSPIYYSWDEFKENFKGGF